MANSYREETAARESHREAFAGQGAVAELLVGSAMAKRMAALWQRAIGKLSLARGTVADSHREAFAGQGAAAEHHREAATAGKVRRATAGKGRYCRKGEPLPERRATARKVRKGVPLPARRDCMEQRVGLFF